MGVESVDKVERSTLAVDCTEAGFRTRETALYQLLHKTTTNEPLRMVQRAQGPKGFEAWHRIVGRDDQRNRSDRSSACAALISNVSDRDRAKGRGAGTSSTRRTRTKEGLGENPRRREDSGSEKVDARESVELSIPWHDTAM